MKLGFSLVEMLIVLAVLGILMGIGTPSYFRWRASTAVRQAAVQLAQDIDGQRSEARRSNSATTVVVSSNSYSLGAVSKSVPAQVTLQADSSSPISFEPPYGTTSTVRVVGVTGKVIVQ
jgi:type IV pilus assembly protein PilA